MTLPPDLTQAILDAVETGFEDQLVFTEALARHPGLRGQERIAQDFLFRELKTRGYAMDRWTIDVHDIAHHPINFNVGTIAGGDWASSVPAWCEFDCRIAIYPGIRAQDSAAEVAAHLRQIAGRIQFLANNPPDVTFNGFFAEGYVLEEGSEAEAALVRAPMASYDAPLESVVTPGSLDGRVFVIYSEAQCLVYGPVSQNIHGFDERVFLPTVKHVTGAITLFIADFCGLEKICSNLTYSLAAADENRRVPASPHPPQQTHPN